MLSPLLTRSTFSPSIIKVQKATVRFSQAAYYTGTTAICLDVWHTECSHRKKKKKKDLLNTNIHISMFVQ